MLIREFNKGDQWGVTQLQNEFMQEFFPEFCLDPRQCQWNADIHDLDKYYLQQGGKFWVAEEGGEIVGVGGFRLVNPSVAEIKRVRVKNRCRGKGLGQEMIRIIEDYCCSHKIRKMLVDTDERLSVAKAMYEKLGYTVYRIERVVEGEETYVNYYFEKEFNS